MTEKEKMLAGEIYNANYDEELIKERIEVKDKCIQFDPQSPQTMIRHGNQWILSIRVDVVQIYEIQYR